VAQVRLDQVEINVLLRSPKGPVAQDLIKRGYRVQNRAKQNLYGAGASGLRALDTGALANSITSEVLVDGGNPIVRVGTNVYYALWIHEGTRRMRARPYLREALNAARG
jgi:phage gpG-like protein